MYELIKIEEDIETVSLENIQWDTVMMVDPRNYEIHEYNIRTFDAERKIKSLEDSVLKNGYRYPCLSDENMKIIDGGRRWRIAVKHGFKLPMIHVNYGEGDTADVERAIDSIIGNMSEPNSPKEVGYGIKRLIEDMNLNISQVAERLGATYKHINNLYSGIQVPKELFPEENPEVIEMWEGETPRSRETYQTILRSTDLPPSERAKQYEDYVKLTYSQKDAAARELNAGLPVDMESRARIVTRKYVHLEEDQPDYITKIHETDLRMRTWGIAELHRVCMVMLHLNPGWISQEQYTMYKDEDYRFEGDQDDESTKDTL